MINITDIIYKHLREEQLSPSEENLFDEWLAQSSQNPLLVKRLSEETVWSTYFSIRNDTGKTAKGYDFFIQKKSELPSATSSLSSKMRAPVHHVAFLRKWGWAAACILLLVTAVTLFLIMSSDRVTSTKTFLAQTSEILPGKDGAILTLADGSRVSLDSIQNGVVALQGGVTAKIVNGTLQYEGVGSEVVFNTMSTPKGRQFNLTLPDGTKVWLNSASSIRYPTVFHGDERRVEVSGEAYFEVAKNKKKPFRLNVNSRAEVEVLGTQFNVNAYEDEGAINTTLIEGIVKVSGYTGVQNASSKRPEYPEGVILNPGQQAQLVLVGRQAQMEMNIIDNADIDKALAWKNGFFNFSNVRFEVAMRQLERWYDIQVVYEKNIPKNIELYGEVTKDITLNDLLKGLSEIGVKCRLEGRRLLIGE